MNVTTEQLFDNARTQNGFTAEPVPESTLRQLYDMMKWGPTSANTSPARIVFVTSPRPRKSCSPACRPATSTRRAPRR